MILMLVAAGNSWYDTAAGKFLFLSYRISTFLNPIFKFPLEILTF